MGSMNNWLAFSLSPQELPPQPQNHAPSAFSSGLGFNSNGGVSACDVSGHGFGLPSDSTEHPLHIPNLRPDGQFGILEAYNRSHQHQDWSMKSLSMDGGDAHFKANSQLSMVVGSSSNQNLDQVEPKLEDFLGAQSFANSCDYMYSNCSMQQLSSEPSMEEMQTNECDDGMNNINTATNSIGLSMFKTWLRNLPAPQHQENNNDAGSNGDATGSIGTLMNAQTLSLSMSTGSQSSAPMPLITTSGAGSLGESSSENNQETNPSKALDSQTGAIEALPRKSIDTFGQRTSIYRGVTRHRWTGRYEAHLWDNSCRREGQTRKGRQVYLGGYDKEEKAARAYDLAALKYWGSTTTTNFPISNYEKELEEMKHMTRQEYVASLRRKSSGFSRGASMYRGVTRHHQHGRWQARIGRVAGNKDLYLGTFSTQEEAAEAYDIAAIKFRGLNAVTNFDMSRYNVKSIMESSTLPIGGAAKRLKEAEQIEASVNGRMGNDNITSQLSGTISSYGSHHPGWPTVAFHQSHPLSMHYHPYGPQRGWLKQEQDTVGAHVLQDLHLLHLGNTHNFMQPSVMPNMMRLDPSPMDQSSGSNSVIYGCSSDGSSESYQGVMGANGGYVMPVSTTVIPDQSQQQIHGSFGDTDVKHLGYENMLASTDSYVGKNMYYQLSQQSSACNYWMPASVQALSPPKSNNMTVGQGVPVFSGWDDS